MAKIKIYNDEYETKILDLMTVYRLKRIVDNLNYEQSDLIEQYTKILNVFFNQKDAEKIQTIYPYNIVIAVISSIVQHPYDDLEIKFDYISFREMNKIYKAKENYEREDR